MRSGSLNRMVTIRKSTSTTDSYGGQIPVWSDHIPDLWASVRPLTMREYFSARQVQAEIDVEIVLRYTTGILPKMRVTYDEQEYEIKSIIDTGDRHRELRLLCARLTS